MASANEMMEASQKFFNDYKEKLASLRESRTDINLTSEAELKEAISTEGSIWEVASKIIDFQEKPIGDQKYIRGLLLSLRDEATKKRSSSVNTAFQSPAPEHHEEDSEPEESESSEPEIHQEAIEEPHEEVQHSESSPEPSTETEQAATHRFSVRPSVSLEENVSQDSLTDERPRQFVVSAEQTPAESEYVSFTPAAFEDLDDARATPSSFIPTTNLQYSMSHEDLVEEE